MSKSWTSQEILWTSCECMISKSWNGEEQIVKKMWKSHEQVKFKSRKKVKKL